MVLRKSEDVETDEICDAVYTIEKRRQEALLLHLGRLIVEQHDNILMTPALTVVADLSRCVFLPG